MKKYNLLVAGGGLSGVAAAVSAAREGLSVLLIEKSGSLGGAISNNLVFPFMPTRTKIDGETVDLSAGIFTEMRERHHKKMEEIKGHCVEGSVQSYMIFSPEDLKFTLDDMIVEAGVDVLFHTSVFEAVSENGEIKSVKAVTKSGVLEVEADFFIDTTGDGELFALAGCDYQLGRESDGLCQPMTTCFRMSGVDLEGYKRDREFLHEKYKELKEKGEILNPREDILVFWGIGEGILHFNTTRIIKHDPTNPFEISKAEILSRQQIFEIVKFLKKYSSAFEKSTVISIANHIGIRESRKLKGVYVLTGEDLINCTKFEDSIALGNYDLDIHNPTGAGTSHHYFKQGEYYTIPYRSLLPKEYTNLLVAGRCISATHEAQASVRIMPICACMGEAAGTAAAVAYKTGKNAHNVDIVELHNVLVKNGVKF
ncbi:MAG: FAD-dependent oxidoreductase [Clostridia bacterium]|nr:FAD-dependent oxidoreductase [Clostridia bacterium]